MHPLPGKTGKEKAINIRFKSLRFCFLISLIVLILDRILKLWAEQSLDLQQSYPVIMNIFHFTLVHNKGAAFGLWYGARSLLIVMTVLIVLVFFGRLIFGHERQFSKSYLFWWSLVIGGALGNLYDRIFFGYVIDYLDFRFWPVFNLADSAICVGVFFLMIQQIRTPKP